MRRLATSAPSGANALSWRAFARAPLPQERAFVPARRPALAVARVRRGLPPMAFNLLLIALITRITLNAPLLYRLHIDYSLDVGNPLSKIHIGAYLTFVAMWLWVHDGGEPLRKLVRHYRQQPALFTFMVMMAICMAYSVLLRISGYLSAVPDSFLSAGMAASLLSVASARQRAVIGKALLWTILLNAAIAIGETLTQRPLVPPLPVNGEIPVELATEFRGEALSGSSLEGAMVTMIGIFLLFRLRLPPRALIWRFIVLEMGLIGFGGRVALVVTTAVLALAGAVYVTHQVALRRLRAEVLGAALILTFALPATLLVLVVATPLGARIANTFYFDSSAQVRSMIWNIFSVIPPGNLMFGTPEPMQIELAKQIGVPVLQGDFENPWLVLLVSLGVVGFTIFMLGFVPFLVHLWRRAAAGRESAVWGRIMLLAVLAVASTSNSFGRKGPLIVLLTAGIYAGVPLARRSVAAARVRVAGAAARPLPVRLRPAGAGAFSRTPHDGLGRRGRAFRRPGTLSLEGGGR